jgi:hypothetical protein
LKRKYDHKWWIGIFSEGNVCAEFKITLLYYPGNTEEYNEKCEQTSIII